MLLPVGIVVATLVVIGLGITWFKRKPKSQIRSDHQPTIDPNPTTRKLIHEIRNPLNSMSLNLQLLAEDLSQPLLKDLDSSLDRVERIQIEIERLDQILTNFQRYANLPPLHFEWSNLGQVLQEVIDFNAPEVNQLKIEVVCQIAELPAVILDVAQIKQAILNLVINANQSMPNGGKLTVRARALNRQVQVEIEDTGEGIDPIYQDKIFDLFFTTKDEGTGVGLAIAKQIIEGHQGQLNIESQLRQGTKVIISIPTDLEVSR